MNRKIIGYCKDEENHWVAQLECGHGQHVRHDPPFFDREWVTTQEGRKTKLGVELNCKRCDEFAREFIEQCHQVITAAHYDGGLSGVCESGRWDLALDALRSFQKRFDDKPK